MSRLNFVFTKALIFLANWREKFSKYGMPKVNEKPFSGFGRLFFAAGCSSKLCIIIKGIGITVTASKH